MFERSPTDIVQEMAMERARRPSLAFLVVEGVDDGKYWRSRLRKDGWCCLVANGKANVRGSLAHPSCQQPALGIVDADYDHLDGIPCPESVCRTDGHDLETLIIGSGAFRRLLHEKGSVKKIEEFERLHGDVLNRLLTMGADLARLRRANHVARWNLKFKKNGGLDRINYAKFVDRKTWSLDRDAMVAHVLNYNSCHDPSAATVLAEMNRVVPPADAWHWLNGHDLAALFAIGLSQVLGSESCGMVEIEGALRLAHDHSELAATALCHSIRDWETRAGHPMLAF